MSDPDYTPAPQGYDYSQDVCTPDAPDPAPVPSAPHEIYDPPIEYDPIGQALVTLPFAVAGGIGKALISGAEVAGEVGEELLAWGASELGIGAVEHVSE